MHLTYQALISNAADYLFILFFSLIGSVIKDSYNTITEKDFKINVKRILISAVVSSILIFSISDNLLTKFSWKNLILLCFATGMTGFELLGKMIHLEFWKKILLKWKKINKIIEDEEKSDDTNKK